MYIIMLFSPITSAPHRSGTVVSWLVFYFFYHHMYEGTVGRHVSKETPEVKFRQRGVVVNLILAAYLCN